MDAEENVVDDGDTMTLSCNTDSKVLSCIWRHTDPISEKVIKFLQYHKTATYRMPKEKVFQIHLK